MRMVAMVYIAGGGPPSQYFFEYGQIPGQALAADAKWDSSKISYDNETFERVSTSTN